jgi:flagellar motor switch protein FliN/FliY
MPEGTNVSESSLELIMDVEVPITVRFGERQMLLDEVLKLGPGSYVQLDRLIDDPVQLFVNQRLMATGEVVVVEDHYAIRITQVASRADRIRSLGA